MPEHVGRTSGAAAAAARLLPLLLVFMSFCSWHGAVQAIRRQLGEEALATTIAELLSNTTGLTTFASAASISGLLPRLSSQLETPFTVFAPNDAAFTRGFRGVTCVLDYQTARACGSLAEMLASKGLETMLLNHVVAGAFKSSDIADNMTVIFVGGATGLFRVLANGTITLNGATITLPDLAATNGVVHVLASVITSDASFNTTSVMLYLKNFADLGPDTANYTKAFTPANLTQMAADSRYNLAAFRSYRPYVAPVDGGYTYHMPMTFDPTFGRRGALCVDSEQSGMWVYPELELTRPASDEDVAYLTVLELAALIRTKQITSLELTNIYLSRLRKYDYILQPTVTLTEALAMEQAKAADELLANGTYLGPLHGIPYGLKDLIAVPPYRTTWGSGAFMDQVIPYESFIYTKLRAAGAVLVAKLVSGEMAGSHRWWGGSTRCPWDIAEDSNGSSAGPGAAVAAALVAFAVGSETGGSIISPSTKNGITGLRPTHGVVGRSWTMLLSQSLDKLGPMTRSAADAAVVLDIVRGRDPDDVDSCNFVMEDPWKIDITKLKVGYQTWAPGAAPEAALQTLREMGVTLVPVNVTFGAFDPGSMGSLIQIVYGCEAGAYFDNWLRSGLVYNSTNQDAWPVRFKRGRMIPGAEYVQAMRMRGILLQQYQAALEGVDAFVGDPSTHNAIGNLVNAPGLTVPCAFVNATTRGYDSATTPRRAAVNVGFFGKPYGEPLILALAMAFQGVNRANRLRPPIDQVEPELVKQFYPVSEGGTCNTTLASTQTRCNLDPYFIAKLTETGIGNTPVDIKLYGKRLPVP